ncbi:Uncharacterised protein [uncultured archaeon]|nr:Uncharacterised protein [uncultured archaeon]
MAGRLGGVNYAELAMRTGAMEHELNVLLEELAQALVRSPSPQQVSQAAAELASVSARLAEELHSASPAEAAEKTVFMDELDARAGQLMRLLPDAILAGEQERWAAQMESVRSTLHAARADLESLSLPHLPAEQRARAERALAGRLSSAKHRMAEVRAALEARDSVSAHPLHQQLSRVRSAMSSTKAHVQARHAQHQQSLIEEQQTKAYAEMRDFFCRQMTGRIYVDGTVIQLRSDLTGRLAEFTLDVPHAAALAQLMGEHGERLVGTLRDPAVVFSARFETRSANEKLHLLVEGGERAIRDGRVSYSPQRFFCSL